MLANRGLESARPGFESLSLEDQLERKIVEVGGWKGPDAVCVKDLKAMGGIDDRAQSLHQTDLDVIQDHPLSCCGQVILSLNVFSVL